MVQGAMAFNFGDFVSSARSDISEVFSQNKEPMVMDNNLVQPEDVLVLVNSNERALRYIQMSEITSATLQTEQRTLHFAFDGETVTQTTTPGQYTITTTEFKLSKLRDNYDMGTIKAKQVERTFDIPWGVRVKVLANIFRNG